MMSATEPQYVYSVQSNGDLVPLLNNEQDDDDVNDSSSSSIPCPKGFASYTRTALLHNDESGCCCRLHNNATSSSIIELDEALQDKDGPLLIIHNGSWWRHLLTEPKQWCRHALMKTTVLPQLFGLLYILGAAIFDFGRSQFFDYIFWPLLLLFQLYNISRILYDAVLSQKVIVQANIKCIASVACGLTRPALLSVNFSDVEYFAVEKRPSRNHDRQPTAYYYDVIVRCHHDRRAFGIITLLDEGAAVYVTAELNKFYQIKVLVP